MNTVVWRNLWHEHNKPLWYLAAPTKESGSVIFVTSSIMKRYNRLQAYKVMKAIAGTPSIHVPVIECKLHSIALCNGSGSLPNNMTMTTASTSITTRHYEPGPHRKDLSRTAKHEQITDWKSQTSNLKEQSGKNEIKQCFEAYRRHVTADRSWEDFIPEPLIGTHCANPTH